MLNYITPVMIFRPKRVKNNETLKLYKFFDKFEVKDVRISRIIDTISPAAMFCCTFLAYRTTVFNGQCPFHDSRPITNLHTDACSSGIGAVFGKDWFYSNLLVDAPELAPLHINFKEALCIVFALRRWAPFFLETKLSIFFVTILRLLPC